MNGPARTPLAQVPTGVSGLDLVLGGGFPQYSFNLIAGDPGSGKTTLAHQIVFANASPGRRILYFSVLGEPMVKMLRYQQQYSFFDQDKVGDIIRFINLSDRLAEHSLGDVLERIVHEVETDKPHIVVVDSFRTMSASIVQGDLHSFMQKLALHLTVWQATTFLVGEYPEADSANNPVFTMADGIVWLYQTVARSSVVRKIQVMKLRGQPSMLGLHTLRITEAGVEVFPRMLQRPQGKVRPNPHPPRLGTGVPGLDEMTGGGFPAGDSVLIAGPAGSGKTTLGAQFAFEGTRRNQPAVIVAFEEYPQEYLLHTRGLAIDFDDATRRDLISLINLRPLDLSVDETLHELSEEVARIGAKRVVIDSLSGFEIALAQPYRDDFRESLYRMVGTLTGLGVTILMTVEVTESFADLHFSPHSVSFMTDDIIMQRYVEFDGQLRKVMTVIKMRGGQHSNDFRFYENTPHGLVIGESLRGYRGVIAGNPEPDPAVRSVSRTAKGPNRSGRKGTARK